MPRNARLFVAFRVLFNARFYYPVLAVLFVDLGLTLDQYALLNVAWALSIVLFELPLGALGDRIGRRPLVVAAAAIMVVEMSVLAFAPLSNPALLFPLFLANRVLSGLAEAAASGADEALAYDSLVDEGRSAEWPNVLAVLGRAMSVAFVLSMVVGGAVYDRGLMQGAADRLNLAVTLTQQETARFPVYLTLGLAVGALLASLAMREPKPAGATGGASLASTAGAIGQAGRWILGARFPLALMLLNLVVDSGVRVFLTLTSTYYRMIGIPAGLFGVLGAAFAMLGFFVPSLARRMALARTPLANFTAVVAIVLAGVTGVAVVQRWWSVVFVAFLGVGFYMLGFFVSHYLNAATESSRRATVLSFKSLANNIAYGGAGWAFALLMRALAGGAKPAPGSEAEDLVFARALLALPSGLFALGVPLLLWSARLPRMRRVAGTES
ncbi:MAG TPA: MFS transporter [Planctomycetota bacterium]|nr:MFS transporter [Planctomycetota bacterium]